MYAALFEASSEALRALAANPRFVGTDRLGFFGVLHTWGRTLEYHPHVHYVVPGGGIDEGAILWIGIETVVFGSSIRFLQSRGWWQIDITAEEVIRRSPFLRCTLIGGVMESECNALFEMTAGLGNEQTEGIPG
ncbi:MAG: transposase [Isosphaeraceae bacterium]|jgi:hypothetical protein